MGILGSKDGGELYRTFPMLQDGSVHDPGDAEDDHVVIPGFSSGLCLL